MFYDVLVASQTYHGKESLTYFSKESLQAGQLVTVPLQRKSVRGIVVRKTNKPTFAAKEITYAWAYCIPEKLLALLDWIIRYYPAPLGLITELFVPHLSKKQLTATDVPLLQTKNSTATLPPLTQEQAVALEVIHNSKRRSILLHGNTGTGKTRLYQELAREALQNGQSVLLLTPEIGLTTPLVEVFQQQFGTSVLTTHSGLTAVERRQVWLRCLHDEKAVVIIGPRSALFSPLANIGLIVMDEAHDGAYKQEQAPYYQTSRVAAQLARLHGARLVLGSATPSVADYYTFEQKKLPIIRMQEPALGIRHTSTIQLIDQRDRSQGEQTCREELFHGEPPMT